MTIFNNTFQIIGLAVQDSAYRKQAAADQIHQRRNVLAGSGIFPLYRLATKIDINLSHFEPPRMDRRTVLVPVLAVDIFTAQARPVHSAVAPNRILFFFQIR